MTRIRLARIEDCAACHELSKIKELATADGGNISENYFKYLVDSDEMFFVAVDDNDEKIIGYILGEPMKSDLAFLSLLTVAESQRGKGIGKLLTDACIQMARDEKQRQIIIHTTKAMQVAWRMYEKMGFKRSEDLDFLQEELPVFGFRLLL